MFLLLYISFMLLNILRINCDQTCDCQEMETIKEIVQQLMFEQKLQSAKLRKMKARQRSTSLGSARAVSADRLSKMETKVKEVDNKLNYFMKEKLDDKEDIATVLKKTLTSEKLERIYFASEMESQMTEMKENVENFKKETTSEIDRRIANISATQYDFKRDVNEKLEDIKGQTDRSVSQVMKDATSSQKLFMLEIDEKLEKTKDHRVAFTAYGFTEGMVSEEPRFPNILENSGDGYDSTTGKFSCSVSGIYHFVVTLSIKQDDEHKSLNCYIYVNAERTIQMYVQKHSHESKNSYPATVSGTLYLNRGDTVYVGDCNVYGRIYSDTSTIFTGFLVSADN
ncbi:uncharacterized protein LOC123538689 [Mercenaria mercenaria]|uniref:uncharacterized protein LOC123538689 n=1 Tax=Mercenaria mercenaria TaxID=6596 RepID=UPI00234EB5F6|nr:uncharacterized protein LOC123538689 [Mercenaria mercenaria]